MKAFKGCVNKDCIAYKKSHYKDKDNYCLACGKPLVYVCSECWKSMPDNTTNKCISCKARKEQNFAQTVDWVKENGAAAMGAMAFMAGGIKNFNRNGKEMINAVKGAKDIGEEVYKAGKVVVEVVNKIKK